MSKGLKKIGTDLRILWHSLFYGLKAADDTMTAQTSGENGIEINQQVKPGGVYADMLEQKVTKEVEEMRDKFYRVVREADKYKPAMKMEIGEDGEISFSGGVTKKTLADFIKHPPVYETEDTELIVIQDVRQYEKEGSFDNVYVPSGIYDYDTNITIEWDFTPRFELDKFAKKVVVRKGIKEDRSFVDLYLPTEASQFGKIDAILISNLYTIFNERNFRSDILDIKQISWVTEKAWRYEDTCSFIYDDPKPVDINVFDGSFVVTFDCHVVEEGKDLVAKFRTKELDEKYANEAPKKETTDIFAIKRREERHKKSEIDLDNLATSNLKFIDKNPNKS